VEGLPGFCELLETEGIMAYANGSDLNVYVLFRYRRRRQVQGNRNRSYSARRRGRIGERFNSLSQLSGAISSSEKTH
jgi:hypothetical protein